MQTLLKNTTIFISALLIGAIVNMTLVIVGPMIIPTPTGVDVTNMESIAAGIHLFEAKHFFFPLLAHSIGTLTGAFFAYRFSVSYSEALAWAVGGMFLLGGIANTVMIPAPMWFIVVDLLVAYIPMAWLGLQLGKRFKA